MINFDIDGIRIDGETPTNWHEALLKVVARLTIRQGQVALWSEVEVPILELAYHLRRWLALADRSPKVFSYQSMESDEPEWLWFKPSNDHWSIGAASQRLANELTFRELREAARSFVDQVVREVPATVGIDAEEVISRPS